MTRERKALWTISLLALATAVFAILAATRSDGVGPHWSEVLRGLLAEAAWPVSVVVVALLLRREIFDLVQRLQELKLPGGYVATFLPSSRFKAPQAEPAIDASKAKEVDLADYPVARKIMSTLWHYQKQHFPDGAARWGFKVSDPDFSFQAATTFLAMRDLIGQDRATGLIGLSDRGIDYCKAHETELGDDRYLNFRPLDVG